MERCKVKKEMRSRGGTGESGAGTTSLSPSFLLFRAPFYLAPLPTIWTPGTGYYPVALCIIVFCCYSFARCWGHSVWQCLFLGRFFSVRLCSSTCIWGVVLVKLRFCPHVVSRLCPHILFGGFVLIFDLRLRPHCYIYLGHMFLSLRLRSSLLWAPVPLLYCLVGLFKVICVWFCLFVFLSRVTRCKYYWFEFLSSIFLLFMSIF